MIIDWRWGFPTVEILHLAGMLVVIASILVLNLRMVGAILRDQPMSDVAGGLQRWTIGGLIAQLITGPLLFMTQANKFYHNEWFRMKVSLLVLALLFFFLLQRRVARSPNSGAGMARAAGVISLVLWFGVVVTGMNIELFAE
jgi:hypothetical protein